jgi:selenocysteine-specific elongation factor
MLQIGDEVQIFPSDQKGRIRGLQSHKRKEEIAVPGSRTAANISGVTVEQIKRGDVVAHPGDYQPTRRIDTRFRLLPYASQSITHNVEVKLFIGAAEVVSRLRLLGVEELLPGEETWLQLDLRHPIVVVRGDRYILRRPSPGETLGGGSVIDPHPKSRHKRFAAATLSRLEALTGGTPEEILLESLIAMGAAPLQDVIVRSELDQKRAKQAAQDLKERKQIMSLESEVNGVIKSQLASNTLITSSTYWKQLSNRFEEEVDTYHKKHPLRSGIPKEELKSKMKLSVRLFNAALGKMVYSEKLVEQGPLVHHPDHRITFDQNALLDLGILIAVSTDVVFRKEDYHRMVKEIQSLLQEQGTISAAQVRDHFNTSRRYVLSLLEYMDSIGVTVREGDIRRLK